MKRHLRLVLLCLLLALPSPLVRLAWFPLSASASAAPGPCDRWEDGDRQYQSAGGVTTIYQCKCTLAGCTWVVVDSSASVAGGNYVGRLRVWGNGSGYDTTGTLATEATGNQPFNDPSQAATQSVNATVAKANHGTASTCGSARGCFKIYTAPRTDNGWELGSGTYDVYVTNVGYSNHTSEWNPCCPTNSVLVGHVTIGSVGMIISATDASGTAVTVSSNIAGEFQIPTTFVTNLSPQEAAVRVHEPNCVNANVAPLTVI